MTLSDKTAIVFGCNGHIAQMICKKLNHEGYNLVVTDLKKEQANAVASEMKTQSQSVSMSALKKILKKRFRSH